MVDAEAVNDEVNNFPRAIGEGVDCGVGAFLKLQQVAVKIHCRAGAAGHDYGKFAGKDRRSVSRHFSRCLPVTGVEGGLAATGLIFWKNYFHAKVLKHLNGCAGYVVIKSIAETSSHEHYFFSGGS